MQFLSVRLVNDINCDVPVSIMQLGRSIDQTTSQVDSFLFSCSLVESHVRARTYVSSYKRWASFPPFRLPRAPSDPVSSVQPELLPAFLMSDRKRAACVIYARDFSPVAPAAPCSCAHCTYRCRTDRVVSQLYRRAMPVSLYGPRHGGRKKTYDWRKSTYTGGKEPVRCQDSAISVPIP